MTKESLVFRGTNAHGGRHTAVSPANSAMTHLSYGRIRLQAGESVAFETGGRETGLICFSGQATVRVGEVSHELTRYDALYVPRGSTVQVTTTNAPVDLAECSAPVQGDYPLQYICHQSDVAPDPTLKFATGEPGSARTINILLGKNVQAGRLVAGVTQSEPGNWTSWPPHEHAAMLEELYVYYDMPAPAFGIQFVYENPNAPDEHALVVREGDVVLMPAGYHPNVSVPGHSINFLWIMAAHRETIDRQFGVVNVQPGFDTAGSGLEASRK